MIRHEIILRIRPEISREIVERILREVSGLLRDMAGVERVRYGVNNTSAYRCAMLVVDLGNESALERMGRHPQHQRIIRRLRRLAESSAIESYVVGSEPRG